MTFCMAIQRSALKCKMSKSTGSAKRKPAFSMGRPSAPDKPSQLIETQLHTLRKLAKRKSELLVNMSSFKSEMRDLLLRWKPNVLMLPTWHSKDDNLFAYIQLAVVMVVKVLLMDMRPIAARCLKSKSSKKSYRKSCDSGAVTPRTFGHMDFPLRTNLLGCWLYLIFFVCLLIDHKLIFGLGLTNSVA